MRMAKKPLAIAAALGLGVLFAGTASATVVYSAPNADLTSPYTISFGGGQASYTFSSEKRDFGEVTGPILISTGGTGLVASLGFPFYDSPHPSSYNSGAMIGSETLAQFDAYSSPAAIDYSSTDTFVGLKFTLSDGIHYGYAEVTGYRGINGSLAYAPILYDYAYETTPGKTIFATGINPVNPVPEPAELGMFGFGVLLIGMCLGLRRRLD